MFFLDIFLILAQNIDCGYKSTHNLCFGPKIRKLAYPGIPQFYYIEVMFEGVLYLKDMFS